MEMRYRDFFHEVSQFGTEDLFIRRLEEIDREAVSELRRNRQVYRYLPASLYERSGDVQEMMDGLYQRAPEESLILGIFFKNVFCGLVELYGFREAAHKISVSCRLLDRFWHKGIASQALDMIVAELSKNTDIEYITASTMTENRASERVLQKNGFVNIASRIMEDWGYDAPTEVNKWLLQLWKDR